MCLCRIEALLIEALWNVPFAPSPSAMPILLRVSDRSTTEPTEFQFDQPEITIGRSSNNDLALPDQKISGHHARVKREDGACNVYDLGSKNHTFVNGVRIGDEPYPIQTGDRIRLGGYVIEFELSFVPANASTRTEARNPFLEPAVRFANALQTLVEEYVFAEPETRDEDLEDVLDRVLNAGEVQHPAIDAVREALRTKKEASTKDFARAFDLAESAPHAASNDPSEGVPSQASADGAEDSAPHAAEAQ